MFELPEFILIIFVLFLCVVIIIAVSTIHRKLSKKHKEYDERISGIEKSMRYMTDFFDTHYNIVDETILDLRNDKKRLLKDNDTVKKQLAKLSKK